MTISKVRVRFALSPTGMLHVGSARTALYEAFGWPVPEFAHLSTILGADRERLSKRHGATSIATFREMGYLREGLERFVGV